MSKHIALLFDTQGKQPPKKVTHEYTWVGGTWIRCVVRKYKGNDSWGKAMDDLIRLSRKYEGCTNAVPAYLHKI